MKKNIVQLFIRICTTVCLLALFTTGAKSQWVQTNGPFGANVIAIAQIGTNLFAGVGGQGVFISTNEGVSWTSVNKGLTGTIIYTLVTNGLALFAGTDKGISITTDNGASWKSSLTSKNVQAVLVSGTNIFIGTTAGLYVSSDQVIWKKLSNGLTSSNIFTLVTIGTTLFAGTDGGIYSSTNNGADWMQIAPPLVNRLAFFGTKLYAATNGGTFVSADSGTSWTVINAGDMSDNTVVWDFAMKNQSLFAATDANGVLVTTDNGVTWTAANNGLQILGVSVIRVYGNNLIAGTGSGVFISADNGTSWKEFNTGIGGVSGHAFAVKGNDLYAASLDHLYKTSDNGRNWASLTEDGGTYSFMNALMFHGNDLFVADAGNGVFHSSNYGGSWEDANTGLVTNKVWSLGQLGDVLFVGSYIKYVYRSLDNGVNWESASEGITGNGVSYFVNIGGNLFSESGNGGSFGTGGVFISKDTGTTWTSVSSGLPVSNFGFSLAVIGTKLYASAKGFGVFVSPDNGTSWTKVSNGLSNNVGLIFAYGTNLLASTDVGIFLSKNGGANWIDANAGLPTTSYTTWSMVQSGTDILVGNDFGFFRRPITEFNNLSGVSSSGVATLQFDISPNPTNGIVTVRTADQGNVHVTITNLIGQRVMEIAHAQSSEFQIDLSNYPNGTYLAMFVCAGSTTTKIIVKD